MLRIEKLYKRYNRKENALDGLDMEVEKGELYGFVGPNGAGEDHDAPDYHRASETRLRRNLAGRTEDHEGYETAEKHDRICTGFFRAV